MASQVPLHYIQQFANSLQLKLQQKDSRLSGAVMSGSHVGEQASPVDQYGAIVASKVVGRYNPMTRVDAPTDRRWVQPSDYDLPQLVDSFDKLRLMLDPTSTYSQNALAAMNRAKDSEILNGLLEANLTGKSGGTSTSLASTQVVAVAQGAAGATNLTVAKLREGKRLLMANDVDPSSEQIYMAINATMHDSLMSEPQIINGDYNSTLVLVDGLVSKFLGINFILTNLLYTGTDDAAGTSTAAPMWVKSGAYLGTWSDIQTDVSPRKDLQGIPTQVYLKGTFGATRLEEKKVVKIWAR